VQRLPAFAYFYCYSVVVALAFAILLRTRHPAREIRQTWTRHRRDIVAVGVLNTLTYFLVLLALRSSTSTYVVALRQLSIAWGVLLGWWQLGERFEGPRRAGLAVLLAGGALLLVSR
jgi:drug/metabolite transporter (DMT)-like permease